MINTGNYKSNLIHFVKQYGINFGVNNVDRLIAITLLCNITQSIRKTTPDVMVAEIIDKIIKDGDLATTEFWTKISYQCEALLEGDVVPFPDYGFKELKDKTDKIKEINENILPF